jgi:tripartite-type tricarboxylate transporter receptor subunit TctC
MRMRRIVSAAIVGLAALLASGQSRADQVADFYKGKTVFLQIGSGVGGAYDITGRVVARYIGKYIPGNPTVVAQNVPGGGSLPLANQFGNTTPRDGTTFGVFNDGMPMTPLLSPSAAHFDPRKFHFLGAPFEEGEVLVVWHTAPVKTLDDVFTKELIVGATSPGAAPYDFPLLTNVLLGTKNKIVTGYQSSSETKLAMERGEVQAIAGLSYNSTKTEYAEMIRNKELNIIATYGMTKFPPLKDVPLFPLGDTEEDHQIFQLLYARESYGMPFATPPDVPQERVEALRQAFEATMRDPDFLADTTKLNLDIAPVSATELTKLTTDLFNTPQAVVTRTQQLLASSPR